MLYATLNCPDFINPFATAPAYFPPLSTWRVIARGFRAALEHDLIHNLEESRAPVAPNSLVRAASKGFFGGSKLFSRSRRSGIGDESVDLQLTMRTEPPAAQEVIVQEMIVSHHDDTDVIP